MTRRLVQKGGKVVETAATRGGEEQRTPRPIKTKRTKRVPDDLRGQRR